MEGSSMKLRTLFLFGAGVMAGFMLARRVSREDPDVVTGPTRTRSTANPAMRMVGGQAQRLAGRATVLSLDAIRKARGAIRERLGEDVYDDAAWT
jgi:hypothetical protein